LDKGERLVMDMASQGKDDRRPGNMATVGPAPVWLRIERRGSTFTTFYSEDGVQWEKNSTFANLNWPARLRVGPVLLNGTGQEAALEFEAFEIKPLPPEPGWIQLFNQQDLEAWKRDPKGPGDWKVGQGILAGGERSGQLFSVRGDFTDFHLRAEVKINRDASSALYFRTPFSQKEGGNAALRKVGHFRRVQIGPFPGKDTGSVWTAVPHTGPMVQLGGHTERLELADTWFVLEVIARQRDIVVKVDGKPLVAFEDRDREGMAAVPLRGHFALEPPSPGGVVLFRKIEVKPLPPPEPAPLPFVLLSRAGERRHATLAEAVAAAQAGDTIEVRGNQVYDCAAVTVTGKPLRICGAPGCTPTLTLDAQGEAKNASILWTDSALVLENLTIRRLGKTNISKTIVVEKAPLRVANCRFQQGEGIALSAQGTPHCAVRNCLLVGTGRSLGFIDLDTRFQGHVVLDNCISTADATLGLWNVEHADGVVVECTHNTFLGKTPLLFHLATNPKVRLPIRLTATGNIFSPQQAVVQFRYWHFGPVYGDADLEALFPQLVSWQDRCNLYPPGGKILGIATGPHWQVRIAPGVKDLKQWHALWNQQLADSSQGVPKFRAADPAQAQQPESFALLPESPGRNRAGGGRDMGADVSLVGPGPAFEAWQRTMEYKNYWQKAVRGALARKG
jgi:hypothetical protein